jgi:hypothetical protein
MSTNRPNIPKSRRGRARPPLRRFRPGLGPLEDRLAPDATPAQIGTALDVPFPANSGVVYQGDPRAVAISPTVIAASLPTGGLLGFPSGGDEDFLILSTGVAKDLGSTGTALTPGHYDVATVEFDLAVPASSNAQELRFDYRFLSNDIHPTGGYYGGGATGDTFTATVNGTQAASEDSIQTLLQNGNPAPGTAFALAGPAQTAVYVIPAGTISVHVSFQIADKEIDDAVDSSVLLDNVRFVSRQVVYLDFGGGNVGGFFGSLTSATVPAFAPSDLGSAGDPGPIKQAILAQVQKLFQDFDITIDTAPPPAGDFMHVIVGGSRDTTAMDDSNPIDLIYYLSHPTATNLRKYWAYFKGANTAFNQVLWGYSDPVIDVGNRNKAGTSVVWPAEIAQNNPGATLATLENLVAVTIAHEIGHNLGLMHEDNGNTLSVMKNNTPLDPNATFQDALHALATPGDFASRATQQNAHAYLLSVLGPRYDPTPLSFPTPAPMLQPPAPEPFELNLNLQGLPGPVYNLQVGVAVPADNLGGGSAAGTVPQLLTASGGSPAVDITVPSVYASPFLFFYGSTTPGGPIDVFSGAAVNGNLGPTDTYVPLFDAAGHFNTTIPVSVGTPGQLQPFGTASLHQATPAGVAPSGFAAAADAGGGPQVTLYNPDGTTRSSLMAFDPSFAGGVRVATADFNGDGVPDLVVGTGPDVPTLVRVLDGVTGAELVSLRPFEAAFTGGVYVAVGDLTGDGVPDLVVTPDAGGGPRVQVYDGRTFARVADFFGIDDPNFRGGARAAVGDVNGDGVGDLIVAAGFGGGPRLAGFDGKSISTGTPVKLFGDFFVFEPTLRNGVFVTAGDLNGDGFADVIVGGGPGGGPRVLVLSGKDLLANTQTQLANFFAGDVTSRGGVRVAAKDLDGDGRADLVTGAGTGAGSKVTAYAGVAIPADGQPPALLSIDAFPGFAGGVFVG